MRTELTCPVRPDAGRLPGWGDAFTETGWIAGVDLRSGCYDFGDCLDLIAHHLVATGRDRAAARMLTRRVKTVRQFMREEYGVSFGPGDDRRDLRRFRLWIQDARWRIKRSKQPLVF